MHKGFLLGALALFSSFSVFAETDSALDTEEVVLKDGSRLTIIRDKGEILAISAERTLFAPRRQQQGYRPFELLTSKGHFPARLEKAPPLPNHVPEEVRNRLRSWRILDDAGNVMSTIFCTEDQGCSVGGYSYTASQ